MELLVWSALASAQAMYPVKAIALEVEGTHVHLMLLVENPDDVKDFMRHFKTESAHSINSLLGRKQRTVWCDGYDSPPVLTIEAMFEKLVYLYTNPAKDNLEESIDEYPGVSTWKMFCSGDTTRRCVRVRRPAVEALPSQELTYEEFKQRAESLIQESKESCNFTIYPNAWFKVFGIYDRRTKHKFNALLKEAVKAREREFSERRQREGRTVLGKERLKSQGINPSYESKRAGRRMWCISSDKDLRKRFISKIKDLLAEASQVLKRWRSGDFSLSYPLGLYPPSMPKLAEPIGFLARI